MKKSLTALFVVSFMLALVLAAGCSYKEGTGGIFDKSEPQKKLSTRYNPWTQMVEWYFFSNDGTELYADELYAKSGDKEFRAVNVKITNKAVEVRGADATVLGVQWAGATAYTKAWLDGIAGVAAQVVPAFNAWAAAHPQSARDPDIVQGVFVGLVKDALAKQLTGGG